MEIKGKNECYGPGYSEQLVHSFEERVANKDARFFLPYLQPGMNILDCGCGPGTITVDLAKLVFPGNVIGVDKEPSQIDTSQKHSEKHKVSNVKFQSADICHLPFADNTFDGVFAHAILQHLQSPLLALKEMYRVLKVGGVIGIRDDDRGGLIIAPDSPKLERLIDIFSKFMIHNGGNPYIGRHFRALLKEAGFKDIVASSSCVFHGTPDTIKKHAALVAHLAEKITEVAVQERWATLLEMKEMIDAVIDWGNNDNSFDTITFCEGIGKKS